MGVDIPKMKILLKLGLVDWLKAKLKTNLLKKSNTEIIKMEHKKVLVGIKLNSENFLNNETLEYYKGSKNNW